jgi:hypothetical protein
MGKLTWWLAAAVAAAIGAGLAACGTAAGEDEVRSAARVSDEPHVTIAAADRLSSSRRRDRSPPTVAITSSTSVSGTITVSADASDNVGVAGVQFLLDGAPLGAEDTAAPYSVIWDTTTATNGSHALTARARDAAGNTATPSPVTVTVSNGPADTTPPTVAITSPANGATVSGNITVSAGASDNVGVAGVQFFLDGATPVGAEDNTAPYSVSWNTVSANNGAYTLTAHARDAVGNRTTSASVTVTVSNVDPGVGGGGDEGPPANLKVAFIGDTGAGTNFTDVLRLIQSEQADVVMHQGDFDYGNSPSKFEDAINGVLGPDFPYFVSVGNHDADAWAGYSANFQARYARAGATPSTKNWSSQMYSMVYKGLSLVFVGENSNNNDAFSTFIETTFADDPHTWKICSWHKNQNQMQVGGKEDEMGWGVYEACREAGAIVATGHEHSYSRTKTLISMSSQIVDDSCTDDPAHNVCISPGRTFAFVSGLGGNSIRDQERCLPTTYPYGCNQEWAMIYTSNQGAQDGALFIVFNVNGDPNLARGYFKNISGDVVDEFAITKPAAPAQPPS